MHQLPMSPVTSSKRARLVIAVPHPNLSESFAAAQLSWAVDIVEQLNP
jgi:hypothetical protein